MDSKFVDLEQCPFQRGIILYISLSQRQGPLAIGSSTVYPHSTVHSLSIADLSLDVYTGIWLDLA